MSVRRAQREIDAREFAEWQAYFRLRPFGEDVSDLRSAQVCATLTNCHRTKGRPARPEDFLMFEDPESNRQSPEQQIRLLRSMNVDE